CQQVKYGVQAVFGPSDPILGQHIHSICDALDIPHLEARLDLDAEAKEFSINLYPAQSLLNIAYQDVMEFLNWTNVAIIYEDDYARYVPAKCKGPGSAKSYMSRACLPLRATFRPEEFHLPCRIEQIIVVRHGMSFERFNIDFSEPGKAPDAQCLTTSDYADCCKLAREYPNPEVT
ncbi:Glutamate receptor, ionotropic kainate 2, partial [Harpegnathos saltator]